MKFFTSLIFLISVLIIQSCAGVKPISKKTTKQKKSIEETIVKVSSKKDESNDKSVITPILKPHKHDTEKIVYNVKHKENSAEVQQFCQKIDSTFKKYNWGKSQCNDYTWKHVRNSNLGDPLIWFVYGNKELLKDSKNITLLMCGVHGDEITPVKFCFDVLHDLKHHPKLLKDKVVLIAPIVSPDSFFKSKPTRTNAKGIDINRNFPTKDWQKDAHRLWRTRYKRDKRRYPGKYAMSEPEVLFQVNLVLRYKPSKLISVHAPLSLLDYDGPAFNRDSGKIAKQLLIQMSDSAQNYKISDYPFFPGSLGNWAGNERDIPTYTLELPNSDWNKTKRYFNMFKQAIHHAIIEDFQIRDEKISDNSKSKKKAIN